MHNSYFFLNWLVKSLTDMLVGARLTECYSQEKDVIYLHFSGKIQLILKAHLRGSFSCLSFPDKHFRARRNVIDLFTEILDREVLSVNMHQFDRSFSIQMESDYELVFKMHGQRSNLALFKNGDLVKIFKSSIKSDNNLKLDTLNKELPALEDFEQFEWNLAKAFPVLGREVIDHIYRSSWQDMSSKQRLLLLNETVSDLQELSSAWITSGVDLPAVTLYPSENAASFTDPLELLSKFAAEYLKKRNYQLARQKLETLLNQKIKKAKTYIIKTEKQLEKIENEIDYSDQADLIMANLHLFADSREVLLKTFDGAGEILIKLKENISPVKHAENLYRKSKNKKIEIATIQENIAGKKKELERLTKELSEIDQFVSEKELKERLKTHHKVKVKTESTEYHEFDFDGFKIRVGKNAKNNDKLTFQNGYKEDMWLHVKDARGSHVLIKYRSDRKFSKIVIEKAAQLAAHYSKRNTEGLVPVIYTPRKFVRKRKGDPAGAVVVDKEQVLLVEPEKW